MDPHRFSSVVLGAVTLMVIAFANCSEQTELEIDDLSLDEISKINILPVFSYQMAVENIFDLIDQAFELEGSEIYTLIYSTDTTVKFIGESIRIVEPPSSAGSIDFGTVFSQYGNIVLDRTGLFEGQIFPASLDLASPVIPDTISIPDATFLPGVNLADIPISLSGDLSGLNLNFGRLTFSGTNGFQSDILANYQIITEGNVVDERSIEIKASNDFQSIHLVDVSNLGSLALSDNSFIRFTDFSFVNGVVTDSELFLNISIDDNWIAQLAFDSPIAFRFDSVFQFPVTLNEINETNSLVYEFVTGGSTVIYQPLSSPFRSLTTLDFELQNSLVNANPFSVSVSSNSLFDRRASFEGVRVGDADNLQHFDTMFFDATLTIGEGQVIEFNSQSSTMEGTLQIEKLDEELVSFTGDLDDDFSFPVLSDALNVSIFENTFLRSNSLQLPDMQLKLTFRNSYDVGVTLSLENVRLIGADQSVTLIEAGDLQSVTIGPNEDEEGFIPLANLQQILDAKPSSISFSFEPTLNSTADQEDSFLASDSIHLEIDFELPMNLDASGLVLIDTIRNTFNWSELLEVFDDPLLRFSFKNEFPLDFNGNIYLLDQELNATPLFDKDTLIRSTLDEVVPIERRLTDDLLQKVLSSEFWVFDFIYETNSAETGDLLIKGESQLFIECQILQDSI